MVRLGGAPTPLDKMLQAIMTTDLPALLRSVLLRTPPAHRRSLMASDARIGATPWFSAHLLDLLTLSGELSLDGRPAAPYQPPNLTHQQCGAAHTGVGAVRG